MYDFRGGFLTDPFLKSVLFAQVFKASIALSILDTCPTHLKEDEFTLQLQKNNYFYERYKDRLFHHSSQIKLLPVNGIPGNVYQASLCGYEPVWNVHESVLSQLITNVTSIRVGFRALPGTKGSIREKHILPGLLFLIKTLSWIDDYRVKSKDTRLLNQMALLHAETSDAFRAIGRIVAKLDTEELSTVEIVRCFPFILGSACVPKGKGRSGCWIYPIRAFVRWYWQFIYESTGGAGTLYVANSLAKHLLNHLSQLLQLSNEGPFPQAQNADESLARVYALTMPILNGFRHRSHISRNLTDTVSETSDIIRQIGIDRGEHTCLSNGSLMLLQSMKGKLHYLNDLSN